MLIYVKVLLTQVKKQEIMPREPVAFELRIRTISFGEQYQFNMMAKMRMIMGRVTTEVKLVGRASC